MIDIVKDLPFEDCETCECFEPNFRSNKLFGDEKCLVNEIIVNCSSSPICREIRRQMKKKEEKQDGTEQQ